MIIPLLDWFLFPWQVCILKPNNLEEKERGREIIQRGGVKKLKLLKRKITIPIREDHVYTIQGIFQKRKVYLAEGKKGGLKWIKPNFKTLEFTGEGNLLNWMKMEVIGNMKRHAIKKAQWEKLIPWAALGMVIILAAIGMGIIYDGMGEMLSKFPTGGTVKILCDCFTKNATYAPF